jgi:predicted double-glycine peptidase
MPLCFKEWLHIPDDHIKIKLPSVNQPKTFSCGASALRAIAVYFKVGPNEENFYINKCKTTSKKGTNPKDILSAAHSLGLQVKAKENMTINNLRSYIDRGIPVICSVQAWGDKDDYPKDDSGHYIVAIGYTKNRVYFMDPLLKGNRGFMSNKEFLDRWHDEEADGTKYIRLGIALWKSDNETKKHELSKAKRIK